MTRSGSEPPHPPVEREVRIQGNGATLLGDLVIPGGATGVVLFAHGSGSSRHSSRNRSVAQVLQKAGLGTVLMDLLTPAEEEVDNVTHHLRFDIPLLADRLTGAVDWLSRHPETRDLLIGLFGASTGAAAALVAAAASPDAVRAVVSRGGRPDLAGSALELVSAPTLLIVGGHDDVVIELNEQALARLHADKDMVLVPGATHLFDEPGTLEAVAGLASTWFTRYLRRPTLTQ